MRELRAVHHHNKFIFHLFTPLYSLFNYKNIFFLILLQFIAFNQINAARRRSNNEEIQITVYPAELTIREGSEASFECRARSTDNSIYPQVRWTKIGGRLPDGVYESGGKLIFTNTKLSHSGRYICLAMHKGRSVEAFAQLQVLSYGPQEFQADNNNVQQQQPNTCSANERSCGNNECVKMEYVCDGERDCRDGSDELNCPSKSKKCEPNEFKCNNDKCVQKMWLCDGDDDCGDNSDEINCKQRKPGDLCQATEFRCQDGRQCVPQSFQCDGTNDCHDGSDEIGCVQPTVVSPPQSNMVVPKGGEFKLTCRAVGVPDPYINWRLNWADVCEPPRCQQVSEGGVGTLTVQNAQPLDQGAYTCEAINVKGRVLATPDCIVRIVSIPAPEPIPQPARSPPEPISSRTCSSPTTYQAPQGCLRCFCFGITDRCRSSMLFRTKEKLFFAAEAQGVQLADQDGRSQPGIQFDFDRYGFVSHKEQHHGQTLYWKMPQRFLGNKVTAYGGDLSVKLLYEGPGPGRIEPLVIIRGNGITLIHKARDQESVFTPGREFTVTVPTYEQFYEHRDGRGPSSREDLMMVLADLDLFMIRATHTDGQTSTSIGDTSIEIAVPRDTQDKRALEVEQCECPPGYTGTSCEDCAEGYERIGGGRYLGNCVLKRQQPSQPVCSSIGAISTQPQWDGRCQCKQNVIGSTCDRCAPESYNIAKDHPSGCLRCWCSGVTSVCESSHFRRSKVELDYSHGDSDQLEIISSDQRQPYKPNSVALVTEGSIQFDDFTDIPTGTQLYWSLPEKFLGDKVTSYGGKFRYKFRFTSSSTGISTFGGADADVILRGNNIQIEYTHQQHVEPNGENNIEVPLTEAGWRRSQDGQSITREHFLMVLADLEKVLIKISCTSDCATSSLLSVQMDIAEAYGTGELALDVEQCQCPPGYTGTSCELCAPNYFRAQGGPFMGICERCECNSHANQCDKEYGACLNCQHNTEGDRCERCKPGFSGDARRGTPSDCLPIQQPARPACQCHNHSPRGCDSYGRCIQCEHNTEGFHCEVCKKGYYGEAIRGTPFDCTACPCPGDRECFLDERGQVQCKNCPPGYGGSRCDECAPGYTRSQTGGGRECEPIGRHRPSEVDFVPAPEVPLRVEILHPKHLSIHEGSRAKWTCKIVSASKPELVEIKWSKIGMIELPSKASQIGHQLIIDQVDYNDVGQYRCTGRLKGDISTDEASLNIAVSAQQQPPPQVHLPPAAPAQISLPKPIVTPPYQLVDEGQQAVFTCLTPGYADCEVEWHYQHLGGSLPYGWQRRGNQIIIQNAQQIHAGDYICSVTHQLGTTASDPGRLEIKKPTIRVLVEPPEQTVELGNPARFRCWVPEVPDAVLTWRSSKGGSLPYGSEQRNGLLNFPKTEYDHQGHYICAAYDPSRDPEGITPIDSTPVVLNIRTKKPFQPLVEPPYQIVDEGQPIQRPYRCWVPGYPDAVLNWKSSQQNNLPSGVEQIHNGAQLNVPRAEMRHAGDYICVAYDPNDDPHGERPVDSTPVRLEVRQRRPPEGPQPPLVDPPKITANIGQPARFRCWVPNDPNAQLTWSPLQGGSLPNGAIDRGGYLIFQSVATEHEGQYICNYYHPESGKTLKSPPVELDVNEPKKPLIDPPEQHVPEGDPSRIRCWVPGDSEAQLRFSRPGGRQLPSGSRDDGRGNLYISKTYKEHEGEYECTAHFPHVPGAPPQVSDLARIYVNPPTVVDIQKPPGKPPAPVATPPQQTVPRGEPARFHCEPNSDTPAQIFWGFGSANGALPTDVSVDDQDILIHAADESTIGDYVCSATNEFGKGIASPVHLSITDQEEPPTARVEPKVWNGKNGENNQFKCYVTGNPYPTISWIGPKGEGEELPENVVDLGDGVLEIKNANKEIHDGSYICTATNPLGEASDDGKVNISPPDGTPKIIIPPDKPAPSRLKLIAGEPLEVRCEAKGEPEPDVEWLHDPGPERGDLPDDFVPITISEQFLRHPSIGLGNSGCYTCRANHQNAFITKGICIEVIEPSGVATVGILGGQHQWSPLGHPVELICAASVSSLIDKVEWSKAGGGELPEHANVDKGVLRFDAFKAEDEGEYECSAYRKNEIIASSRVELHPEGDTKPELLQVDISPPNIRVVNQGDSIVLDCNVHGHSNDQFNYAWSLARGGSLIRDLGKSSQLQIKSADPTNDYGIYRCEVESEDGEAVGQAQTAVAVGFESDENAIESKFDEDSEAIFTCPVFVVPGSTVQWSKENGDPLPSNSLQQDDKLIINKFDDSMIGIYRCSVQYGQNTINGYLDVKIFVPDTTIKVLLNVSDESVTVGSRAWLDCLVVGDPNAKIEFLKDDSDQLPDNAQVTGNRLLFTSISSENTGKYRCRAHTSEGILETSALLNVENDQEEEETEAEKRRKKHLFKPHKGLKEHKGPEYIVAEQQDEGVKHQKHHHYQTEVIELEQPIAPSFPSKRRRLRRLRHQRRRALVKKGNVGVIYLNNAIKNKDDKLNKNNKKKIRGDNLRRRAERYHRTERSHNNNLKKHYHHYEIRHDLPPISGRQHSTFGSWFWS